MVLIPNKANHSIDSKSIQFGRQLDEVAALTNCTNSPSDTCTVAKIEEFNYELRLSHRRVWYKNQNP